MSHLLKYHRKKQVLTLSQIRSGKFVGWVDILKLETKITVPLAQWVRASNILFYLFLRVISGNTPEICVFLKISNNYNWWQKWSSKSALIARFMGPTGPRWAPCWSYEPCYLGGSSYLIRSLLCLTMAWSQPQGDCQQRACHPGGHHWDYYTGALSLKSNQCISLED